MRLEAESVLGRVLHVEEAVVVFAGLVKFAHEGTSARGRVFDEKVDSGLGTDARLIGRLHLLLEMLVDNVLELATKHRAGNEELLFVDLGQSGSRSLLDDHRNAIRILGEDPSGFS